MEPTEPKLIFRPNITKPNAKILSELANDAPGWRNFAVKPEPKTKPEQKPEPRSISPSHEQRGKNYLVDERQARVITAALALRRPVLVSGHAGLGKTSLAYAVAWQLGLGDVLRWPINSRSTLKEGLYEYDAIARLHDFSVKKKFSNPDEENIDEENIDEENIGEYITLGPLGTALLPRNKPNGNYQPRVLLIDELDKSDIDLPNDLLHVLEEGKFIIPEIARSRLKTDVNVKLWKKEGEDTFYAIPPDGDINCDDFPLVIMTTNGEREFSPAFRRRCLEVKVEFPDMVLLAQIIKKQLEITEEIEIKENEDKKGFYASPDSKLNELLNKLQGENKSIRDTAIDQILNALYFTRQGFEMDDDTFKAICHSLTQPVS